MKLSLPIYLFLIFGISIVSLSAQIQPQKFDEFEMVNSESLLARLDAFAIELVNNLNTKGFIIIHRSEQMPFGSSIRFGEKIKRYLIVNRGFETKRFEVLYGEPLINRKTEIWIGPENGNAPPFGVSDNLPDNNKTLLFDAIFYPTYKIINDSCCIIDEFGVPERAASFQRFGEELKKTDSLNGYLIFYGKHCNDCETSNGRFLRQHTSKKTISKILKREKLSLIRNHQIDTSRIISINGGYRKYSQFELWFVPKGNKAPKPTPDVFPRNIKRKSK